MKYKLTFKTLDGEHHNLYLKGEDVTKLILNVMECELLKVTRGEYFEYFIATKHIVSIWYDVEIEDN